MTDYEQAKQAGLTNKDRWGEGIDHYPMSLRLMDFLKEHDFNDYDDHFCWKSGGDGDNGEALMFQMDAFWELMDGNKRQYVNTSPNETYPEYPCVCHKCIKEKDLRNEMGFPLSSGQMIVCPDCGNKRCPRASDHELDCTGSNEPGQKGSIFE